MNPYPPWLSALDPLTRAFWRATGRPVDLGGREHWLRAPMRDGKVVAAGWLQEAAAMYGGVVRDDVPGAGLLADLAELDGPQFHSARLDPTIRDFYVHTSDWRMEVWTQWNPVLQPGGELISRLFGRRVQQLAIPTRPMDVARGMDSRIALIVGDDGSQRCAAWLRTLRATGEYVYSGCYGVMSLPGDAQPVVHVAFPLEAGNVQVFLRPQDLPDGSLELRSTSGRFGEPGAYVVVDRRGTHAARVPLHETFHVYVDAEGVLRTDHHLRLGAVSVVRLHYKLTRTIISPRAGGFYKKRGEG